MPGARRLAVFLPAAVVVLGVSLGVPGWTVDGASEPPTIERPAVPPAASAPSVPAGPTGVASNPDGVPARPVAPDGVPATPDQPAAERWVTVQHTSGLGLVLRPGPGSAARVLTLQEGTRVRVTGGAVQNAGRAWLPVVSLSGKSGWVAGEFVTTAP